MTKKGGLRALESVDGRYLYYAKGSHKTSLWRIPVEGGKEVQVIGSLAYWASFEVVESGIYFVPIPVSVEDHRIEFYNFLDQKTRLVAKFDKLIGHLAVSPDRSFLLFAMWEDKGSDLMMVENFK